MLESEYLSVQFVKDSPTKKGVILSAGTLENSKDGQYQSLQVLVEIDGKKKKWKLNRTSLKNVSDKLGRESTLWVGSIVNFQIMLIQGGKESIIGTA